MIGKVLAEYEVRGGALRGTRLVLHGDRLLLQSDSAMEVLPLARIASVRIAFEREPARLNWAVALLVIAVILALLAGPLMDLSASLIKRLAEPGRRESFDTLMASVYGAIGGLGRTLPWVSGLLALGGAVSAGFFWVGRTTLVVSFAATEREISVRGRDQSLAHFADELAAQLVAAGKA